MRLSKVLSKAIVQAVNDLELCMADPNYIIDFNSWHSPYIEKSQFNIQREFVKCSVCFAGSVMAQTLKVRKDKNVSPSDFSEETKKMLVSLDYIRRGEIEQALWNLRKDKKGVFLPNVKVKQTDFPTFKKQMLEISVMLKKHKL